MLSFKARFLKAFYKKNKLRTDSDITCWWQFFFLAPTPSRAREDICHFTAFSSAFFPGFACSEEMCSIAALPLVFLSPVLPIFRCIAAHPFALHALKAGGGLTVDSSEGLKLLCVDLPISFLSLALHCRWGHQEYSSLLLKVCQLKKTYHQHWIPQGIVISPVLFTPYANASRANSSNVYNVKLADDPVMVGLLTEDEKE